MYKDQSNLAKGGSAPRLYSPGESIELMVSLQTAIACFGFLVRKYPLFH